MEEGVSEPMLLQSVPATCEVVRTRALPIGLTRKIGLGSLAFRALLYLRKAGSALLKTGKFDLVFFFDYPISCVRLGSRIGSGALECHTFSISRIPG